MADKGVRTQHPEYGAFSDQWEKCRDVMSGEDAVHKKAERYLPRLEEQKDTSYRAMKTRTPFYNASWRTVEGFRGMMFRKPPTQIMSEKVKEYAKDITLSGVSLDQFVKDLATDVLQVGRVGLLVDYPPKPDTFQPVTVAVAETLGLRPTIKSYCTETIINWKYKLIGNKLMLSMVTLKEELFEPDPDNAEFGQIKVTQYRVLDLTEANIYRQRVFRIKDQKDLQVGGDIVPEMNGKPLAYIPFVFINSDGTKATPEEPPLIDLVNMNLKHYRVSADYEHGCHITGLPTPWAAGFTVPSDPNGLPTKLYLGSEFAWVSTDPKAKAGYLEFTGAGLTELRENLNMKKQEMATLGARMLADTTVKQVETFGATAIKHTGENSILAAVAISISIGVKTALDWFSEWSGAPGETEYDINRDFLPVQMDGPTLAAYVAAWQSGAISEAELFDNLKRGDVIDSEKTLEEHQQEIDSAPPPAPPSTTQPGALGTTTQAEKDALEVKKAKAMPQKIPPKKKAA